MPNIRQLISLKEKYSKLDGMELIISDFLNKSLIENVAFQKALQLDESIMNEHFNISSSIPDLIEYFEGLPSEDVVLLFIDITKFSQITETMTGRGIARYLDSYYEKVFPIIFKYQGAIDKLMGDGIVCVFGKPFISENRKKEFDLARNCATAIIRELKGTKMEVKVALHSGIITYYRTPGNLYEEYTMVGKPLTELFRLESESKNNSINYYTNSAYDKRFQLASRNQFRFYIDTSYTAKFDIQLKGISYSSIKYFEVES